MKKKLCGDNVASCCAQDHGFSLHAAVRIGAGKRDRLERLCRYVTRPPFAQDRLAVNHAGDVIYRFRNPWRNGKTAVVMDPMTLSGAETPMPPSEAMNQSSKRPRKLGSSRGSRHRSRRPDGIS